MKNEFHLYYVFWNVVLNKVIINNFSTNLGTCCEETGYEKITFIFKFKNWLFLILLVDLYPRKFDENIILRDGPVCKSKIKNASKKFVTLK